MQHKIFLLFFCLFTTSLFAQNQKLTGTRVESFANAALDKSFERYNVYSIDVDKLLTEISQDKGTISLAIELNGLPSIEAKVKPNKVCADNYVAILAKDKKTQEYNAKPAVYPFLSVSEDNTQDEVALTFAKNLVYGFFQKNGLTYFIEPLHDYDPTQPRNWFVVYDQADVKNGADVACGAVELTEALDDHKGGLADDGTIRDVCGPNELEIAIANDFQMVTKFGSPDAVEAHNIALINAAAANWDNDFNQAVFLTITAQFIPTSAEEDPFPSTGDRNVLIAAIRTFGNNGNFGNVTFDYGHLRSPRYMYNQLNQQVLGSTYTNQYCTSYRYSVFSDYNGLSQCQLRHVISHEMGHLFGASHTTDIMAPSLTVCSDVWAAVSKDEINPSIASAPCLSNLPYTPMCTPPATLPMPMIFYEFLAGTNVCWTTDDPCIGGFIVHENVEDLTVTVDGRTICMFSSGGLDLSMVEVIILDHCGKAVDKASHYWYVSSVVAFDGGSDDRNDVAETNTGLRVQTTNDFINIEAVGTEVCEKSIQVFDASGKLAIDQKSSDMLVQVPVDQLQAGLWIVRVTAGDQVITRLFTHF